MRSEPRHRTTVLLLPALALSALLLGCNSGSGGVTVPEDANRYAILRGRELLVRLDTSTGQVWIVPPSGDGGWFAMGDTPSDAKYPNEPERYRVKQLAGPQGPVMGERSVRLLRLDMAAGRAWLAEAAFGAEWVEIPDTAEGGGGA